MLVHRGMHQGWNFSIFSNGFSPKLSAIRQRKSTMDVRVFAVPIDHILLNIEIPIRNMIFILELLFNILHNYTEHGNKDFQSHGGFQEAFPFDEAWSPPP